MSCIGRSAARPCFTMMAVRSKPLLLHTSRTFSNYADRNVSLPKNLGIRVVPNQNAWVIERFGKFHRILEPGLRFLIPLVDRIAYVHNLKEEAIPVAGQTAITLDNVTIHIDGVLYVKVLDPVRASYGVEDLYFAIVQLAQTTMRSELGKMTLDQTFAERENLNAKIVKSLNLAADTWGIQCLRYEIRDITPPQAVRYAMELQAEAERKKRAQILNSEGAQRASINTADGKSQSIIMEARAHATATELHAQATAKAIREIGEAIKISGGEAVSLRVAEQYIEAFGKVAKYSTTMLLPANTADPASMVAQAMSLYKNLPASPSQHTVPPPSSAPKSE